MKRGSVQTVEDCLVPTRFHPQSPEQTAGGRRPALKAGLAGTGLAKWSKMTGGTDSSLAVRTPGVQCGIIPRCQSSRAPSRQGRLVDSSLPLPYVHIPGFERDGKKLPWPPPSSPGLRVFFILREHRAHPSMGKHITLHLCCIFTLVPAPTNNEIIAPLQGHEHVPGMALCFLINYPSHQSCEA